MALLNLKKDYQDGQILYGADLNQTNTQVETAVNLHHNDILALYTEIGGVLQTAYEYTDDQINAVLTDFTLTEVFIEATEDLDGRVTEVSTKTDETFDAFNTFVDETYVEDKGTLQLQIDGKIESYFQETDPNTWVEADREKHNGDLWYKDSVKLLKRYDSLSNLWVIIEDQRAIDAYSNAATAQSTADGKAQTFVTTPSTPYSIGDLWSGGATGDLKICIVTRATGAYEAADWELASKYTDDTDLVDFIENNYTQFVNTTVSLWYNDNDPSIPWSTDDVRDLHIGDLWRDINNDTTYSYYKNELDEYSWITENVPSSIFDQIDGKKSIFTTQPTTYHVNDIWIIDLDASLIPDGFYIGDIVVSEANSQTFDWDHWKRKDGYIQSSLVNQSIDDINTELTEVVNDMDLNLEGSKLSRITQNISSVNYSFAEKGGANLIPNSLLILRATNTPFFERTGTWTAEQSSETSLNTESNTSVKCSAAGYITWNLRVKSNTYHTLSLKYLNENTDTVTIKINDNGVISTLKTITTVIGEFTFESFLITPSSDSLSIIIEAVGDGFAYSDLMLNYGAILEDGIYSPNPLKWQPAHGEMIGTNIKLSYEGIEISSLPNEDGEYELTHIIDESGDYITDKDENIITKFDVQGIITNKISLVDAQGTGTTQIDIGEFTILELAYVNGSDEKNCIEY